MQCFFPYIFSCCVYVSACSCFPFIPIEQILVLRVAKPTHTFSSLLPLFCLTGLTIRILFNQKFSQLKYCSFSFLHQISLFTGASFSLNRSANLLSNTLFSRGLLWTLRVSCMPRSMSVADGILMIEVCPVATFLIQHITLASTSDERLLWPTSYQSPGHVMSLIFLEGRDSGQTEFLKSCISCILSLVYWMARRA